MRRSRLGTLRAAAPAPRCRCGSTRQLPRARQVQPRSPEPECERSAHVHRRRSRSRDRSRCQGLRRVQRRALQRQVGLLPLRAAGGAGGRRRPVDIGRPRRRPADHRRRDGVRLQGGRPPRSRRRSSRPATTSIVPKGSSITTLAELKGKTIGVPFGQLGARLPAQRGRERRAVAQRRQAREPRARPPRRRRSTSGKVDALAIWNPQAARRRRERRADPARRPAAARPDVGFTRVDNAISARSDPPSGRSSPTCSSGSAPAYPWGDAAPGTVDQAVQSRRPASTRRRPTIEVDNGLDYRSGPSRRDRQVGAEARGHVLQARSRSRSRSTSGHRRQRAAGRASTGRCRER